MSRKRRRTRPAADVTLAQISIRHSLELAGAMTPSGLADIERVKPSTVARIIGRLEAG